jgi:protein-L-isoaspartate(D-aspartate) O-methyltransferase
MLELLDLTPGNKVLDVGSGSGWTTALMAHVVGTSGSVLGVERVPELVTFGGNNIAKVGRSNAHIRPAEHVFGAPQDGPFDRILVSAAARTLPQELVAQLCMDGILVLPIRDTLWRVQRREECTEVAKFPGYVFVPLISDM